METFFNVNEQVWLFIFSCVLGVGLGIAYDMIRMVRILLPHHKVAIFVEDMFYIVFFAMTVFIFTYEKARGQLRFFIFIGAILGLIIYILTVGNVVVNVTKMIVTILYKILFAVYKIFIAPIVKIFVIIYQKLSVTFVQTYSIFKKIVKRIKKSLKKEHGLLYNKHTQKFKHKNRGEKNNGDKKAKTKKSKKRLSNAI